MKFQNYSNMHECIHSLTENALIKNRHPKILNSLT